MLGNAKSEATIGVDDPKAVKPVKKQGALKGLLRQFTATGMPPLHGEEVLPPRLIGDGNYHWYPLAWLRWLAQWERIKTLALLMIVGGLLVVYAVIRKRDNYQVTLPEPAAELLLKARNFDVFNQNQVESFIIFAVNAANQISSDGMPGLGLLEGSVEPAIYLRLQQKAASQKYGNLDLLDYPIYTLYVTEVTRWRYNPATRLISAYVKGFRLTNTLSGGKAGMEPYRAQIEIFWEPASNRNKWGYYLQRLDEFFGAAADAYDVELKNRDRSGF